MATIAVTTGSHAWQMLHWDLTPHLPSKMAETWWSSSLVTSCCLPIPRAGIISCLWSVLSSNRLKLIWMSLVRFQSVLVLLFGAFLKHLETMIWWFVFWVYCFYLASVWVLFVHPKPFLEFTIAVAVGTVKARAARLPSAELMAAGKPGHPGSWR